MKKVHIIGLGIIAMAIGIIISTASDYSTYETFSSAQLKKGKDFQIVGTLDKSHELEYNAEKDPNYFSFVMKDKNGFACKVVFHGSKPQDFERTESIVLTGRMNGDFFDATHILMKCPSKYKNDKLDVNGYIEAVPSKSPTE